MNNRGGTEESSRRAAEPDSTRITRWSEAWIRRFREEAIRTAEGLDDTKPAAGAREAAA